MCLFAIKSLSVASHVYDLCFWISITILTTISSTVTKQIYITDTHVSAYNTQPNQDMSNVAKCDFLTEHSRAVSNCTELNGGYCVNDELESVSSQCAEFNTQNLVSFE